MVARAGSRTGGYAGTLTLPPPHDLGLPADASAAELRQTRTQVLDFLGEAPEEISGWASLQAEELAHPTPPRSRRRIVTLLALVLVPLIIWGVYKIGEAPPERELDPAMTMGESAAPALDQARVAELEAQVEQDPSDTAAMSELGTLYLTAGDLANAGRWQQRILADHPDDIDARLALGVVLFNQGELEAAEQQWTRAVELDPTKAEPHYNLGFLHLAADPPDMDQVEAHWAKVIELDPGSDMAETIANHLASLGSDPEQAPAQDGTEGSG